MTKGFYKHTTNMDCFMEILRIQYEDSKKIKSLRFQVAASRSFRTPNYSLIKWSQVQFKNWIKFDGTTR